MREYQKKAFDFASESTRLIITLSTGMIALTITFSKDIVGDISIVPIWPLVTAWVLFFLSIIFGVLTMLSLTGTLLPLNMEGRTPEQHESHLTINSPNITLKSAIQILLFILALFFTSLFGIISLERKADAEPHREQNVEIKIEQSHDL